MEKEHYEIDIGDTVVCDSCNDDYTHSTESGGVLVGSYAYCPTCAPKTLADLKKYDEEHLLLATCPPEMSFHDWVMQIRNDDNRIIIS